MELNGYVLPFKGGEVHVVECPGCLWNGVQICVSVKNKMDVPRLKHMAIEFRRWYEEQARKEASSKLIIAHGGSIN